MPKRSFGQKSREEIFKFLGEHGLERNYAQVDSTAEFGKEINAPSNFIDALRVANEEFAMKTAEPVGSFSRKIAENTSAQEAGARLKGRRTL